MLLTRRAGEGLRDGHLTAVPRPETRPACKGDRSDIEGLQASAPRSAQKRRWLFPTPSPSSPQPESLPGMPPSRPAICLAPCFRLRKYFVICAKVQRQWACCFPVSLPVCFAGAVKHKKEKQMLTRASFEHDSTDAQCSAFSFASLGSNFSKSSRLS